MGLIIMKFVNFVYLSVKTLNLLPVNEELLQFSWKHQLFENKSLLTTKGEQLQILHPGQWNADAGPDFFNASVKIGDTLWAGNVEVHLNASDWIKHNHQQDKAYNNVILHVVLNNDVELSLPGGGELPALVIKMNQRVIDNYEELLIQSEKPACYRYLELVDPVYIRSMIDEMMIERLQSKMKQIEQILSQNQNNWNETFYQRLAINFGFKTNALPFEMLTRSLPLKVLGHHSHNLFQLEALLFGQSGLLNEQLLGDDYYLKLREEYEYLAKKYGLRGMEGHLWKFLRMRPANFPTVRIAQFAALLNQSENLFSKLIESDSWTSILTYFKVQASEYWTTHYRFNQTAKKLNKKLGTPSIFNLMINTVVPMLYLYGERNNKAALKHLALDLLEAIPPEQNQIILRWSALGVNSLNAYDTQALIQLKNVYCDHKKCLKCQIGNKVINR